MSKFFEVIVSVDVSSPGVISLVALVATVGILPEEPGLLTLVKIASQTENISIEEQRSPKSIGMRCSFYYLSSSHALNLSWVISPASQAAFASLAALLQA